MRVATRRGQVGVRRREQVVVNEEQVGIHIYKYIAIVTTQHFDYIEPDLKYYLDY